jgi:hypothetical protein
MIPIWRERWRGLVWPGIGGRVPEVADDGFERKSLTFGAP